MLSCENITDTVLLQQHLSYHPVLADKIKFSRIDRSIPFIGPMVFTHAHLLCHITCSIFILQEPKLTRSHVRQAVASSVARGAVSPEKIVSCYSTTHYIPSWEGTIYHMMYVYAGVHKLLVYIVGEGCVVGLYTLGSVCLPRHNQFVCLSSGN